MTHFIEAIQSPPYKGYIYPAKDSIDRWSGLSNLSRFLLESNTLNELMERASRSVVEILGLDFCRILILEDNGHYYCRTSYYRDPEIVEHRVDYPEPLSAERVYQNIASTKPALIPYFHNLVL